MGYAKWWDHSKDLRKRNSGCQSAKAVGVVKELTNKVDQVSVLVATTGNIGKLSPNSTLVLNSTRTIDYSTTYHMTFASRHVHKLEPSTKTNVS